MSTVENLKFVQEDIKKFGKNGARFEKFALDFYNYKIAFMFVVEILTRVSEDIQNTHGFDPQVNRKKLSEMIKPVLTPASDISDEKDLPDRYGNLKKIQKFIGAVETGMQKLSGHSNVGTKTLEASKLLMDKISLDNLCGFPLGYAEEIIKYMNQSDSRKLSNLKNDDAIRFDIAMAKMTMIHKYSLLPDDMKYDECVHSDEYQKIIRTFDVTPRSAAMQMHLTEQLDALTSFETNNYYQTCGYLLKRYSNNLALENKIKNHPNASHILNGEFLNFTDIDVKISEKAAWEAMQDDIVSINQKKDPYDFKERLEYLKQIKNLINQYELASPNGVKIAGKMYEMVVYLLQAIRYRDLKLLDALYKKFR